MSLLSDCFLSNCVLKQCSADMTAFSSEALVTCVMIGTVLSTLSLSCFVGSGSSMHVLPVMPRILEISAVLVGSNTSIDGVTPGSGSTAVVQCKLTSNLSICSWKKRENVSQPSTIEQNSRSCNHWTSNYLRMLNMSLLLAFCNCPRGCWVFFLAIIVVQSSRA